MNKRIEELKKLATENIMGVKILNADTFADLIIRECIKILVTKEGNDKTVDAIWDLAELGVDVSNILDEIEY